LKVDSLRHQEQAAAKKEQREEPMGTGHARVVARLAGKLKTNIPPAHAALLATLATCVMLGCAWWWGLREPVDTGPVSYALSEEMIQAEQALHGNFKIFPNSNSRMYEADEAPLAKGNRIPALDAPGWLNGRPDENNLDGKVLVIDVWDGICPYCSLAAPALVKVNAKYHDQGVVFVGLTTANEDETRQYVDHWHFSWANGYNALATIDALQAHAPTLFVVAADGRILWNDGRARWHHDYVGLGRRLERAIDDALAVEHRIARPDYGANIRKGS
jgi:thiol-disulfide isomerase/thioredoxin